MRSTLAPITNALLVVAAFALSGCASTRRIDTQVNSFAQQEIANGSSYQFDRLPSQAANPKEQDQLEAMAQQALAKVGLTQKDGAALRVQVTAVQRLENALPYRGVRLGVGLGWVFGHGSIHLGNDGMLFPGLDNPTSYWRQVSLIVRNAAGTVVFESHASNEDVWSDGDAVLAALLDAALDGFPTPPSGERQVNIDIPR